MAIIGVLISRVNVGIELFITNLIYAPIAYLFVALSGLTVIKILQILQDPSNTRKLGLKEALAIFGAFFIVSIVLTVFNVVLSIFNILSIVYIVIIGILWVLMGLLAKKNIVKSEFIHVSIASLVFTLGIFYGAILNTLIIPLSVYFMFITALFLQLARELVKSFNKKDRGRGFITIKNDRERDKILKISLIFQGIAIIFFILILYSNITYAFLYLFVMLIGLIIISAAMLLTFKSIREKKDYLRTSLLLKYGILIELIAFLLVGS